MIDRDAGGYSQGEDHQQDRHIAAVPAMHHPPPGFARHGDHRGQAPGDLRAPGLRAAQFPLHREGRTCGVKRYAGGRRLLGLQALKQQAPHLLIREARDITRCGGLLLRGRRKGPRKHQKDSKQRS